MELSTDVRERDYSLETEAFSLDDFIAQTRSEVNRFILNGVVDHNSLTLVNHPEIFDGIQTLVDLWLQPLSEATTEEIEAGAAADARRVIRMAVPDLVKYPELIYPTISILKENRDNPTKVEIDRIDPVPEPVLYDQDHGVFNLYHPVEEELDEVFNFAQQEEEQEEQARLEHEAALALTRHHNGRLSWIEKARIVFSDGHLLPSREDYHDRIRTEIDQIHTMTERQLDGDFVSSKDPIGSRVKRTPATALLEIVGREEVPELEPVAEVEAPKVENKSIINKRTTYVSF